MICKYCGKEIPKGEVWNPDENGNGYHHKCLIDMEFDENEAYMENLRNHSIIIPEGATNGDMIKAMFPSSEVREIMDDLVHYTLDGYVGAYTPKDWWNTPYKKEVKE